MLKNMIRAAFKKAGYDLTGGRDRTRLALLDALERLLPSVPLVIDVGANRGQYRDYLRSRAGYRGPILSFEPNTADFAICQERSTVDPAWSVHQLALGDEEGVLPLNVMEHSDLSSFRKMRAGETEFANVKVERVVEVPVKRLDRFFIEAEINPKGALLKTDTQGFDMNVVRGAPVEQLAAIQIEVTQIQLYESTPDMMEAIADIRLLGFDIAAITPVSWHGAVVIEFDVLFVRKK